MGEIVFNDGQGGVVVVRKQGIPGGGVTEAQLNQAVTDHENADPAHAASAISYGGSDVAAALGALEADTGWILPELATDITVGTFYAHRGYRRRSGVVEVRFNVAIANPDGAKLIFTLPAGFYVPGDRIPFSVGSPNIGFFVDNNGDVKTAQSSSILRGSGRFLL